MAQILMHGWYSRRKRLHPYMSDDSFPGAVPLWPMSTPLRSASYGQTIGIPTAIDDSTSDVYPMSYNRCDVRIKPYYPQLNTLNSNRSKYLWTIHHSLKTFDKRLVYSMIRLYEKSKEYMPNTPLHITFSYIKQHMNVTCDDEYTYTVINNRVRLIQFTTSRNDVYVAHVRIRHL